MTRNNMNKLRKTHIRKILKHLKQNPSLTNAELAALTGIDQDQVLYNLEHLQTEEYLKFVHSFTVHRGVTTANRVAQFLKDPDVYTQED